MGEQRVIPNLCGEPELRKKKIVNGQGSFFFFLLIKSYDLYHVDLLMHTRAIRGTIIVEI